MTTGALARVLVVGAGGIGIPAAWVLAAAHNRVALRLVDDDRVEITNLHRQILFSDDDVGHPKLDALAAALHRRFADLTIDLCPGRFIPSTSASLLHDVAVVVDATDNFASRFLISDACHVARVPVVHAAAIRWQATVMAVSPAGRPCYRCLFEDLPPGQAPDCATAGVVGPVCGVAGAIAADRALRILAGDAAAFGTITTYDGLTDSLRSVPVFARKGCALCGETCTITALEPTRYVTQQCDHAGEDHDG